MHFYSLVGVLLVSCLYLVQEGDAAITDKQLKGIQMLCRKQSGVADAVYNNALKGNMDVKDPKLQCYAKCIFQQGHALKSDGKFDLKTYVESMTDERRKLIGAVSLECEKDAVDDKDLCKKSMNMYECLKKKHGEHFRFV